MANEFIIRNGFISKADGELSGSLRITSNVSASAYIKDGSTSDDILLGDGTTTSLSALDPGSISGLVSGSSQINYPEISNIPDGIISGSSQLDGTTINNLSGSFSGSFQGDGSGLTGISADVPQGTVSGSSQLDGTTIDNLLLTNVVASGSFSGSFQGDGSGLTGIATSAWQNITGSTFTCVDGGKYVADSGTRVVFSMPTTNNIETVRITGKGVGGWQVDVPSTWTFTFVDEVITDNIQSNEITDSVELLCTGNNSFHVVSSVGNITFNNI